MNTSSLLKIFFSGSSSFHLDVVDEANDHTRVLNHYRKLNFEHAPQIAQNLRLINTVDQTNIEQQRQILRENIILVD